MFIQRLVITRAINAPLLGIMTPWGDNSQSIPDVCDDDKMFAVSLVTVKVRVAHLEGEVQKSRVFHLGLGERWEVVGFCPFNDGPVPSNTEHSEPAALQWRLFQINTRNYPNPCSLFNQWTTLLYSGNLKFIFCQLSFILHSSSFLGCYSMMTRFPSDRPGVTEQTHPLLIIVVECYNVL